MKDLFLLQKRRRRWAAFFSLCCATFFGSPAHAVTGHELFAAKRYEEALERFVADQVDSPQNVGLMLNIGATLYKLGRFAEAAQAFKQAAQTEDPKLRQQAEYDLGNALFREQAYQEAVQSYEKAVAADPNDREARENLATARTLVQEQPRDKQPQDPNQSKDDSAPSKDAGATGQNEKKPSSEDVPPEKKDGAGDTSDPKLEPPVAPQEPSENKQKNGEGKDPTNPKSDNAPQGDPKEAGNPPQERPTAQDKEATRDAGNTMSRDRALRLLDKLGETHTVRPQRAAPRPPAGGKPW